MARPLAGSARRLHSRLRRRIERAKDVLAERQSTIAEVAAKSGFSSAMELTRTLRHIVGTTPSAYRRDAP